MHNQADSEPCYTTIETNPEPPNDSFWVLSHSDAPNGSLDTFRLPLAVAVEEASRLLQILAQGNAAEVQILRQVPLVAQLKAALLEIEFPKRPVA
jgi:hypothetical protein